MIADWSGGQLLVDLGAQGSGFPAKSDAVQWFADSPRQADLCD